MSKAKTTKFYHVIEDLKYDIKLGTISQEHLTDVFGSILVYEKRRLAFGLFF